LRVRSLVNVFMNTFIRPEDRNDKTTKIKNKKKFIFKMQYNATLTIVV